MNQYVVTLLSVKPNELSRFLSKYSDQKIIVEEGTFRWSCEYLTAHTPILMISTLLDNIEDYHINAYLSINHHDNIEVSKENMNDMMQLLFLLEEF